MVKKVEIHGAGSGRESGDGFLEKSINTSLNRIREREDAEIVDVKPLDYELEQSIRVLVVYDVSE